MSHEDSLNPSQLDIFKGFVEGHLPEASLNGARASYYGQTSAHVRDAMGNLGIDLNRPKDAFNVMAGLSIGTIWSEGLVAKGLTAKQAGEIMRVSLASLFPRDILEQVSLPSAESEVEEQLDPRIAETLKPEETAIIVVDVMDGYCRPDAPLPQFLNTTIKALDGAVDKMVSFLDKSRELPIATTVFTRMVERPDAVPANLRLKMEVDESPAVAEVDGEGWDYYKVQPEEGDHEITKHNYDTFMGTDLHEHLQERGVKTVILVGGYASVCVDSTARTAAQLGYHTFVPADLTADPDFSNSEQTPDVIRKKLVAVNEVLGYMPLHSSILDALEQNVTKS